MQAMSDSSRSEFLICDVAIEHPNNSVHYTLWGVDITLLSDCILFLTVCSESAGKLNRAWQRGYTFVYHILGRSLINIAACVCVCACALCVYVLVCACASCVYVHVCMCMCVCVRRVYVHVCACVCEQVWEAEGFHITHCMWTRISCCICQNRLRFHLYHFWC